MFIYLIIFTYYIFICFVLFYFIKNKIYYRLRKTGKSIFKIKITGRLLEKINLISHKIGNVLMNRRIFKIKRKNVELLKLMEFEKRVCITPESFLGYKIILFFLFTAAGGFAVSDIIGSFIIAIISGALGYFTPDFLLLKFSSTRRNQIERDLPDIIDLLTVAMLSGQNVYNAIKIVISKYRGCICSELSNFIRDVNMGAGKLQAYRNLIERSNSDEFKNFIFLLIQSEKYGSSINDILKRKSNYIKFKTFQSLEKKVRKTSVLILFPLVFLIMPSFIILVGGPLIYTIGGNLLRF